MATASIKALLLCSLLLTGLAIAAPGAAGDSTEAGEWNFEATLDGKPIGTHRFKVSGTPQAREVRSDAAFVVRLLGIPVYRYKHHAEERWQGDCLRGLRSQTDDDGQAARVDQSFDSECLMAFAYWNPRMVTQRQLVDPQTGRVEPVSIEPLPDAQIMSRGDVSTRNMMGTTAYMAGNRMFAFWVADGLVAELRDRRRRRQRCVRPW